jgi:hypothetical protein
LAYNDNKTNLRDLSQAHANQYIQPAFTHMV